MGGQPKPIQEFQKGGGGPVVKMVGGRQITSK